MKLSDLEKKIQEKVHDFLEMMALGASACQLSAHNTLTTFYAYY
ncbi:hypothetical protein [Treponema sp.]|nr:hypothetical protein [Treponema sp.]